MTPFRYFPPAVIAAVVAFMTPLGAGAATVFTDSFNYSGWNTGLDPMNAAWSQKPATGSPAIISESPDYPALETPFLRLSSRVISTGIGQTLTTDFELTINARHTDYSQSFWVALMNPAGTQGYGLRWDSSTAGVSGGNGSLRVVKFSVASVDDLVYNGSIGASGTIGDYLAGNIGRPGRPASAVGAEVEFVSVKLSWSDATDTLTLSIGGSVVGTYSDAGVSSFSSIYLGAAGSNVLIGDISVSSTSAIPEPSTAALGAAIIAGVLALGRRRR